LAKRAHGRERSPENFDFIYDPQKHSRKKQRPTPPQYSLKSNPVLRQFVPAGAGGLTGPSPPATLATTVSEAPQLRILHVDGDTFFASCEIAMDASLSGRPVWVGGGRKGDGIVPFSEGRRMAAMIPGARFVPLEGENHLILEDEPAWPIFLAELRSFLAAPD
jgi:pimeloyl-ACP methyl ester carboxylesterase